MKLGMNMKVNRTAPAVPKPETRMEYLLSSSHRQNRRIEIDKASEYTLMASMADAGLSIPNTEQYRWPDRKAGAAIVESALMNQGGGTRPYFTKDKYFQVNDGMILDVTHDATIVFAILIPKKAEKQFQLEAALNNLVGTRSFTFPEGTKLYENAGLNVVGGVYNTLRLPYKKLIRNAFEADMITSDPAVIRGIIVPRIPRNLGLSQMQQILANANAVLGNVR